MIEIKKPDYWITVGNAYFYDDEMDAPQGVSTIKQIGVAEEKAEQKIYGSGVVYEVVSQTTSTTITIDSIQLPTEWVDRYQGREGNGAATEQKTTDRLKEFSFGYTIMYSGGDKIFKWYPRCQLTAADETIATKTADAVDPSRQYTIVAMPTEKQVVNVTYDQSKVPEDQKDTMLDEEGFFKQVVKSAFEIQDGKVTTPGIGA